MFYYCLLFGGGIEDAIFVPLVSRWHCLTSSIYELVIIPVICSYVAKQLLSALLVLFLRIWIQSLVSIHARGSCSSLQHHPLCTDNPDIMSR